ncbi:MAG: c-type cytochrome [Kangiellaceae bacterium]|nr:c-type cytochrome [Kangiellaceae bacterium]
MKNGKLVWPVLWLTVWCGLFSLPQETVAKTTKNGIFDSPENLKVLNKNISSAELRDTMKSFAMGLGVRCTHCHVGKEGQPLSTYDFAADDKANKLKARVMLRMVKELNSRHIAKLEAHGSKTLTQVECITCHRGQAKPKLIQSVMAETLSADGGKALAEQFQQLREQYYGSHTFDFSEMVVPMFAQQRLTDQQSASNLIPLLELNLTYFPQSTMGLIALAAAYEKTGNKQDSLSRYKEALKTKPDSQFIQSKIKALVSD